MWAVFFFYFSVRRTQVPLQSDVTWADCEFARWQWEREREGARERELKLEQNGKKRRNTVDRLWEGVESTGRLCIYTGASLCEWDWAIFLENVYQKLKRKTARGFNQRRKIITSQQKATPPLPPEYQEITVARCPSCAHTFTAQVLNGHLRYLSVHDL